ncbi:MAG TPA: sodium:proton antiporter NhaD, partial [Nitrococcus sp.]|nr:sodium:proton antiporter NhaD [Nitrococcus sp.]
AAGGQAEAVDLTGTWVGLSCITLFVVAYLFVMTEELTGMRKSQPVMLAAGLIWGLIALAYAQNGDAAAAEPALRAALEEYAELFLFLLTAMTYVNAMTERNVFEALRSRLASRGFSYRQLFWTTGFIAFFLSPMLDNMTTALVLAAVVLAVGVDSPRFVGLTCISIVVAANAGGAYSPFGDITTLMVWQAGQLQFGEFFELFGPALVNFLVPAALMHFAIPTAAPPPHEARIAMKRGARRIMLLFALTVATAVLLHNFLDLPPFLGMMMGMAYLQLFGYYLRKTHVPTPQDRASYGEVGEVPAFDMYRHVARAEWDTLLFFYGIILGVAGLGYLGYLAVSSDLLYTRLGPTFANTAIGLLSAVIDNIPIMAAVLHMNPAMSHQQWLLITLTAGVGGSLLSIGSAAGVALMGQAQGRYTFLTHLRWTPAIALGYAASILTHLWLNAG